MSRYVPISRRTLHDELASRLREMIVEGELAPGSRIQERLLCDQFGVSRTPIREALKVLSAEGLVSLEPNRGASVTELTLSDLEEAFPIMGALEALAAELACKNITDEQLDVVKKLHAKLVRHYGNGRLKDYFRTNEAIHEAIAEAAGNATLNQMLRGLSGRVRRARFQANMTKQRWAEAIAEHEEMMGALSKRDGRGMGRLMKRHLANKFASLKANMV